MAIQNRRGAYADFDKSKMVAGEIAVVQSGDPNGSDGTAVYVAFQSGNAKRLTTHEDIVNEIANSTDEIEQQLVTEFEQDIADDLAAAQQAVTDATSQAEAASESASQAAQSAQSISSSATQIAKNTTDITNLKDDLNDLSTDGVVASAEQLLSDKYTIDQVPYHYRASGGNGADREYDEIVGGTVNWRQRAENTLSITEQHGLTFTKNADGTTTVNGTATASGWTRIANIRYGGSPKDHIFLYTGFPEGASSTTYYYSIARPSWTVTVQPIMYKHPGSISDSSIRFYYVSGTVFNNLVLAPQVYDLTMTFGTEISDYLYSLNSGVLAQEKLQSWGFLTKDYYEYNPVVGTLLSVSGLQSHDIVGFNQFDEEIESGYLDNNGANAVNASAVRSKNYIPVFGGQNYCFTLENNTYVRFRYYNTDKSFIGSFEVNASTANGYVFVPPSNAHYMRFWVLKESANSDFCINISSNRNGEYEPYVKHSYPLDSSLTLRGIPKLDSNNQIYFDGDTYAADGTVARKYGIVDLGTLDWNKYNSHFYSNTLKLQKQGGACICSKYITTSGNIEDTNKSIRISPYANKVVEVYDSDYTDSDAASFKTAMSGVMFVYELATPTTETAEPFTNPQKVDLYGTEEYVTTSIVPVGHYTKYPENLKAKIENLDLSMIAPIETGTTASQAYAVGKYFLLNNKFCKAKTAIASGATFTLGTNYEVTTVADELYTALNA